MTLENTNDSAGQGDFMIFQSLQHSSNGEPWREAGGEVFEGVDHQVDPGAGERGDSIQSYRSSVLLLDNI